MGPSSSRTGGTRSRLGRVQRGRRRYWRVSFKLRSTAEASHLSLECTADGDSCRVLRRLDGVAELGVNFDHILQKSLTVLNPLSTVDAHIMDDADLAGPLVFCSVFASFLLLVNALQATYERYADLLRV